MLLIGSLFIPYSPRRLLSQNRLEEARVVLERMHGRSAEDRGFVDHEMIEIQEQITLERSHNSIGLFKGFFLQLFSQQYRWRIFLSCFVMTLAQFSGVNVLQSFQSIFYGTVGFTGRWALLVSGIYGFMGLIGQVLNMPFIAGLAPPSLTKLGIC